MSLFKVSGDRISIWLGTYEVASQVFLHSCEGWKLQFSVTKFPALLLQEKKKATNKPKPWTSGKIIITNSDDSAVVTVSDSANSTFGTKTEEFNFKKWRIACRNECEWHPCGVQNIKRNCFLCRYINKNLRVQIQAQWHLKSGCLLCLRCKHTWDPSLG